MSEIKVNSVVNATGDNDSGIDLATNDNIKFKIANSQKAMIDSSGNLLVGTTDSDIRSSSSLEGMVYRTGVSLDVSRDGGVTMNLNRLSSDGTIAQFRKDGSTVGSIANIGSAPVFRNVNEDGISVLTDGGRGILVSTNNSGLVDDDGQIGSSTYRWNQAFIKNGVTTGSDKNEKQNIESLTSKELKVANKLSALFKTYKWKDSVAEKGDKARTHTGIIAQDIQSAFSAEGLDASNYGMFMSDTWTNEDGKEQTRLGVRYPELFSFIFSSIEARLTALESK